MRSVGDDQAQTDVVSAGGLSEPLTALSDHELLDDIFARALSELTAARADIDRALSRVQDARELMPGYSALNVVPPAVTDADA